MLSNTKKLTNLSVHLPKKIYSRFSLDNKSQYHAQNIIISDIYHQKAYLSSQIIKMISKPILSVRQMSLKNQIRQFLQNDKITNNNSKQEIYNIFDNGISIDTNTIYKQSRIKNSFNDSKIIFHPTTLTTGQMFKKLNQISSQKLMIGHYGISKTFSTILYQKLTQYIIDYKMRTQPKNISKNIFNSKRLFYWTIQMQDIEQTVNKIIQNQLLDSEKKFFDQNKTFKQNWKSLCQAYSQRKILNSLVIDQINNLFSQVRQTGYTSQKRQSLEPKFQKIITLQKIIQQKLRQFYQIHYLSPINIQQYLLRQLVIVKQPKHYKEIPSLIKIYFESELEKQENRIQIIDYFIEVFDSFFKNQVDQLISKQMNSLYQCKKKFYQILREQLFQIWKVKKSFYITQLVINQSIKQLYDLKNSQQKFGFASSCLSLKSLQKQLILLFKKNIQNQMPKMLEKRVQNFFNKASKNYIVKLFLMIQIYKKFQSYKANNRQTNQLIKLNKEQISTIKNQKYQQMLKVLDQHLFSVFNDQIILVIPPQVFFKLEIQINEKNKQTKKKKIMQYIAEQLALKLKKNYSKHLKKFGMGVAFQNIIKIILTSGNSSFIIKNSQSQHTIKRFDNINQNIGIFNVFDSIKNYDLFQHINGQLNEMIQKSKQKKISQLNQLFLPVVKNTQAQKNETFISMKEDFHKSSKDFEFLLINYNHNQKKFSFYSFDVTIDKKVSTITEKIQKFLESYQNLNNKNQKQMKIGSQVYSVQLHYYTITPCINFLSIFQHVSTKLKQKKYKKYQFKECVVSPQYQEDKVSFVPKKNNFFLKQIGHLSLGKNILIKNEQQKKPIIDFQLYKILLKENTK